MKVLSIGTDRKLFEEGSSVLSRNKDYVAVEKMEELHIIVFSLASIGLKEKTIGNLHLYPTNSLNRLMYVIDAVRIGRRLIKNYGMSRNNSVISCQDPFETGLVGYFLRRKFKLPLQLQIHTDFLSPYFRNTFLNRVRALIAKYTIPKADSLRVVSTVIADSVSNKFKDLKAKISILPIYVDVEKIINTGAVFANWSETAFEFTVLMVSRFTLEKQINVAIEAFKKVIDTKKNKNIGLYIIGDGPEEENLRNQINKLDLETHVKIRGWETQDLILSFYKNSDIFLLTSEYEGYGMTLIEAGAAGCPIVTTEVGIAKTDLFKNGENSFVCPVGDVDCLARGIIELEVNDEKRELFKDRMQDSIKKTAITREEYVKKYVDLLENLI